MSDVSDTSDTSDTGLRRGNFCDAASLGAGQKVPAPDLSFKESGLFFGGSV
jgi:hypothetical protein